MKRSIFFLLIGSAFVGLVFSCVSRDSGQFSTETFRRPPAALGVDVADISIMYPPMTAFPSWKAYSSQDRKPYDEWNGHLNAMSKRGFWPKLVSDSRIGKFARSITGKDTSAGFLSRNHYNQLMSAVNGTYRDDFDKWSIRLDVDKRIVDKKDRTKRVKFNLEDPDRWRIVSFRLSPCPYATHHELGNDAGEGVQVQRQSKKNCTPEVRLVAQPIIGETLNESLLAYEMPVVMSVSLPILDGYYPGRVFGDHGIHLFYRLDGMEEAKEVAEKLHALKVSHVNRCPTANVPLGPHPCLLKEAKETVEREQFKVQTEFAGELLNIMKSHTRDLHKIAMWGSTQNQGPWGFFFGEVKGDKFEWKKINTLRPKTFSESKKITPYQEGMSMLYTRGSSIKTDTGNITSANPTVRPETRLKFDSLEYFLLNQLRFSGVKGLDNWGNLSKVARVNDVRHVQELYEALAPLPERDVDRLDKYTGRYISDLSQMVANIDSPTQNSEFTVSCVSCHLSKAEGGFIRRWPYEDVIDQIYPGKRHLSSDWYYWRLKRGYEPIAGLSGFTHRAFQIHPRKRFGEVYITNQFSHYFRFPQVSNRVVNESSEAADYINKNLLQKPNPVEQSCNIVGLEVCMQLIPEDGLLADDFGFKFHGNSSKGYVSYHTESLPGLKKCLQSHCVPQFANWTNEKELKRVREHIDLKSRYHNETMRILRLFERSQSAKDLSSEENEKLIDTGFELIEKLLTQKTALASISRLSFEKETKQIGWIPIWSSNSQHQKVFQMNAPFLWFHLRGSFSDVEASSFHFEFEDPSISSKKIELQSAIPSQEVRKAQIEAGGIEMKFVPRFQTGIDGIQALAEEYTQLSALFGMLKKPMKLRHIDERLAWIEFENGDQMLFAHNRNLLKRPPAPPEQSQEEAHFGVEEKERAYGESGAFEVNLRCMLRSNFKEH